MFNTMTKTPDLSDINFGEHAPTPSSDKLEQLSSLVEDMEKAEIALQEAEQTLAERKARLRGLVEHELPDLMIELGQPILHTSDGRKIQIKEVVRARLPEAQRPLGHEWLINNGHAGIIKRTVEVAFAAVEDKEANQLLGNMEQEYGANARQVMKVEASTLTSFVKKQLARESQEDYDGEELPRDIFEIAEFNHVKVDKKKAK